MSYYSGIITEQLTKLKRTDINPLYVEAYMREVYHTLDNLDRARFNREVKIAVKGIDQDGLVVAREVAKSYGLLWNEKEVTP